MKYDLVKSLYNSTESARTVQMLLPHLGHNHSQITVYVPAKRGPLWNKSFKGMGEILEHMAKMQKTE